MQRVIPLRKNNVFGCEAGGLGIRDIDIDDASPEIVDAILCQRILLAQHPANLSSTSCLYLIDI